MPENLQEWQQYIEFAVLTDIGMRRTNNQDAVGAVPAATEEEWKSRGHVFLVADGMGAHAAGELASKLAVDLIPLTYKKRQDLPPAEALREAIADANRQIHTRGQGTEEFRGMGTTVCVLVLLPEHGIVAHVGDSRAYRIRNNQIQQLTFDHSLVWELRAVHRLNGADMPAFIPRNIITRSLGPSANVEVDIEGPFELEPGDIFLLCTDGLSGQVSDAELGMLASCLPPQEAVRALVDLANFRGGPDNISVVIARVQQVPNKQPARKTRSSSPAKRSLQPLLQIVLLLVALGSLGLAAFLWYRRLMWSAVLAGVFGIVSGICSSIFSGKRRRRSNKQNGQRCAPYSTTDCSPNESFASVLARDIDRLRQSLKGNGWEAEKTGRLETLLSEADQAASQQDFATAIAKRAEALTCIVEELKKRRPRR